MDKFRIVGGHPLRGTVSAAGAKNAAVAVIPAALLSDEISVIDNLSLIHILPESSCGNRRALDANVSILRRKTCGNLR